MNPFLNVDGYVMVRVRTAPGPKGFYPSRLAVLLLENFRGPRPYPHWVPTYRDGDRSNVEIDNLEWGPRPHRPGGRSKLTREDIQAITEDYSNPAFQIRDLIKKWGVNHQTIRRAVTGKIQKPAVSHVA